MRLTDQEIETIRTAAREVFGPDAVVRLFGSRLDDARQGGDIDLHVDAPRGTEDLRSLGGELGRSLTDSLRVEKVDVVAHEAGSAERPIDRLARLTGVDLRGLGILAARHKGGCHWREEVAETVVELLAESLLAAQGVATRLAFSKQTLDGVFPIQAKQLAPVAPAQSMAYDAMLLQVQNLADILNRRIFRSLYMLATREVTPRLEDVNAHIIRLGLVDAEAWKDFVLLRNELAHGYSRDKARQAEILNRSYVDISPLLGLLERTTAYATANHPNLIDLMSREGE